MKEGYCKHAREWLGLSEQGRGQAIKRIREGRGERVSERLVGWFVVLRGGG